MYVQFTKYIVSQHYNIIILVYQVPPIDTNSDDGIVLNKDEENNSVTFKNVNFTYPARPDVEVI